MSMKQVHQGATGERKPYEQCEQMDAMFDPQIDADDRKKADESQPQRRGQKGA